MRSLITLTVKSTHFYLIDCTGGKLLVDAGWEMAAFAHRLKQFQLPFSAIRYIMFTHTHPDHAGLVQAVRERSGARLIIHERQIPYLDDLRGYSQKMPDCRPIILHPGDLVSPDRAALRALGIDGQVVPTPGHSDDSISLALDGGAAFTGDLTPPVMADLEQTPAIRTSWQTLLDLGCQTFYPSHSGPVNAEVIRQGFS